MGGLPRTEVTWDVVLDLLPLYLAGEVSADTRTVVETYLESDPELAEMAKQPSAMGLPKDLPVPLTKEDEMEAYKEAKRWLFWRTVVLGVLISFTLLSVLSLGLLAVAFFTP
jgi:anti-sigma factor RsiW